MAGMKPAPPPAHVDEAETIRLLVEGDGQKPCEVEVPGGACGVQSTWASECPRCGAFGYWCEAHHDLFARRLEHGVTARCRRCRTPMPTPFPWVLL